MTSATIARPAQVITYAVVIETSSDGQEWSSGAGTVSSPMTFDVDCTAAELAQEVAIHAADVLLDGDPEGFVRISVRPGDDSGAAVVVVRGLEAGQ